MSTIKYLEPQTAHEPSTHTRLHFRRDFGSFQQHRAHPQRLPETTRAYLHGDPLRSIDWRAYARTDQLLINQQQNTASVDVVIAVSCIPAMCWPPSHIQPAATTKLETALRVALHLAFIHTKILDRVTLCLIAGEPRVHRIFSVAEVLDIYENFSSAAFSYPQILNLCAFETVATNARQLKGEAQYWLSDGLQHDGEFLLPDTPLHCFLHILSSYELKSDWLDNDVSYFETPQEALGKNLRRVFHPRLKQWLAALERNTNNRGGKYLLLTENSDISFYLDFLRVHLHDLK